MYVYVYDATQVLSSMKLIYYYQTIFMKTGGKDNPKKQQNNKRLMSLFQQYVRISILYFIMKWFLHVNLTSTM